MIDRTIPFYNMILKCDKIQEFKPILPNSYQFRMYQEGDEKNWAELEFEIGDFETVEKAKQYFLSAYCSNDLNEISKRCVFVINQKNEIVGSCIAWKDLKNNVPVASLHWLIVSPQYQGKGIGKALCQKVMQIFYKENELPIYLHTQPWSYKAIILYVRQGFNVQKVDSFSSYENQFDLAINTLEKILPKEQYYEIINHVE
ncbi:acetyltransferase, GNAT family [Lachnospiraceae bacterium TWA4]|nr:acetyltransferase, GNAT family [Lachnospiraceae bacterium TWA4]